MNYIILVVLVVLMIYVFVKVLKDDFQDIWNKTKKNK